MAEHEQGSIVRFKCCLGLQQIGICGKPCLEGAQHLKEECYTLTHGINTLDPDIYSNSKKEIIKIIVKTVNQISSLYFL